MLKVGDKVSHYMETHKVGTIVNIYRTKSNLMTVGGTTETRMMVEVKYENEDKIYTYFGGDILKSYD